MRLLMDFTFVSRLSAESCFHVTLEPVKVLLSSGIYDHCGLQDKSKNLGMASSKLFKWFRCFRNLAFNVSVNVSQSCDVFCLFGFSFEKEM